MPSLKCQYYIKYGGKPIVSLYEGASMVGWFKQGDICKATRELLVKEFRRKTIFLIGRGQCRNNGIDGVTLCVNTIFQYKRFCVCIMEVGHPSFFLFVIHTSVCNICYVSSCQTVLYCSCYRPVLLKAHQCELHQPQMSQTQTISTEIYF